MTSTALPPIADNHISHGSTLDPSGLGSIPALPFVPEAILRQHRAFIATDNRFRAAARLLQALWREDRNLPIGVHPGREGKTRRLGSSIAVSAGMTGANFIHPAIARLAKREMIYREAGAAYDDNRLLTNLLSSQPLVFNLFGPLKLDLTTATAVFDALARGFMSEITEILFEHSPGRGNLLFSGDGTAFDVLIRGHGPAGQRRFIAIEVKYSESGHEPLPRFTGRYDGIAPGSGLFIDAANPALRTNPVQQLFRQMCLAHTMIETGLPALIGQINDYESALTRYAGALKDGYVEVAKALVRINAMKRLVRSGDAPMLHDAILHIAESKVPPAIDAKPYLLIFGFDKAQRDDPTWRVHLQKLERHLGGRVRAIGNPTRQSVAIR